ncbi:transcription initiation factor TFIID subunit 7 [Nematocida major]|uniref:transcription initiation factor TFIID subunit 7 n=1 Tax=Nematocida major TaxID=1912982 RepID=UPI002008B109|nr:transcription initiation factor TFIID subunit 7 [Nematocida major]KAH9387504.1 transcription initiation factor TFIID subunit 7 [Nematocida major]
MEDQFIIRPPESICEKVHADIKKGALHKISIRMTGPREGTLTYENKAYPGIIADLPCIIESHKTLDNRQFIKTADISKILIFSEDKARAEKASEEGPLSGITPPMRYVKRRRFRKRLTKVPIIEEIEREVNGLMQRDKEAVKVDLQLVSKGGSETEEDISSLAAEIELNLLEDRAVQTSAEYPETLLEEQRERERLIRELTGKIEEKKEQLARIVNPILKKRFYESIQQLEREREEVVLALEKDPNEESQERSQDLPQNE